MAPAIENILFSIRFPAPQPPRPTYDGLVPHTPGESAIPGRWVMAIDIREGDQLWQHSGSTITVDDISVGWVALFSSWCVKNGCHVRIAKQGGHEWTINGAFGMLVLLTRYKYGTRFSNMSPRPATGCSCVQLDRGLTSPARCIANAPFRTKTPRAAGVNTLCTPPHNIPRSPSAIAGLSSSADGRSDLELIASCACSTHPILGREHCQSEFTLLRSRS